MVLKLAEKMGKSTAMVKANKSDERLAALMVSLLVRGKERKKE